MLPVVDAAAAAALTAEMPKLLFPKVLGLALCADIPQRVRRRLLLHLQEGGGGTGSSTWLTWGMPWRLPLQAATACRMKSD